MPLFFLLRLVRMNGHRLVYKKGTARDEEAAHYKVYWIAQETRNRRGGINTVQ